MKDDAAVHDRLLDERWAADDGVVSSEPSSSSVQEAVSLAKERPKRVPQPDENPYVDAGALLASDVKEIELESLCVVEGDDASASSDGDEEVGYQRVQYYPNLEEWVEVFEFDEGEQSTLVRPSTTAGVHIWAKANSLESEAKFVYAFHDHNEVQSILGDVAAEVWIQMSEVAGSSVAGNAVPLDPELLLILEEEAKSRALTLDGGYPALVFAIALWMSCSREKHLQKSLLTKSGQSRL